MARCLGGQGWPPLAVGSLTLGLLAVPSVPRGCTKWIHFLVIANMYESQAPRSSLSLDKPRLPFAWRRSTPRWERGTEGLALPPEAQIPQWLPVPRCDPSRFLKATGF